MKQAVAPLLAPHQQTPWEEVRDRLNRKLQGWSGYFRSGTRLMAYGAVDNYVYQAVRRFLRRRHKVASRGTERFPAAAVFGQWGVLRLRHVHVGPPPCASR